MKGIRPRNLLSEENGAGTHLRFGPVDGAKPTIASPRADDMSAKVELLLDQGLFDRDDDGV
jgi:hypothetical protein